MCIGYLPPLILQMFFAGGIFLTVIARLLIKYRRNPEGPKAKRNTPCPFNWVLSILSERSEDNKREINLHAKVNRKQNGVKKVEMWSRQLLASLAIWLKMRVGQDWQDTVLQHEMHRLLSLMLLAEFLRHPVLSYCSSINHSERRNNTSEFQNIFAALPINNKDDASEKIEKKKCLQRRSWRQNGKAKKTQLSNSSLVKPQQ